MAENYKIIRVTSKGQMTLPLNIRKKMNINQGDYLKVFLNGDEVIIKKVEDLKKLSPSDSFYSLIGEGEGPEDFAENHEKYLLEAKERKIKYESND